VDLTATVYLPTGGPGKWPVIMSLTPYGRTGGHNLGLKFARAGFVFIGVDVRGRGDSGGVFVPHEQEAQRVGRGGPSPTTPRDDRTGGGAGSGC
jgi:predicted acyl esterase